MNKSDFIFMLIRSALWQISTEQYKMTPWEYKEVITFAEKQCVIGLVIDSLRSNNIELQKKCVIHMLKLHNSLQIENRHINESVVQLVRLLEQHNIQYMVVKGQTLGAHYPKPLLRVPGDIDFYVIPRDRERTMELLTSEWKIDDFDFNSDGKEIALKHEGTTFELHNALLMFESKKNASYFNELVEKSEKVTVKVGECETKTLEPTLNVFYTFGHLFHHFRSEGVAIRQLCDLALLLHKHHDVLDKVRLAKMLDNLGYTRAFASFGSILIDKLGLPEEEFPMKITEKDRRMAQKVLKVILEGGNWGEYGRKGFEKKGLSHALETGWIRISHYVSFFRLSPKENFMMLTREVPRRVMKLVKRL